MCTGEETSLEQCNHTGFYKQDCGRSKDIGIICSSHAQLQVRLVNGTLWNGLLEISYHERWGLVCSSRYEKELAQVFCRMLGFNTSQALTVSEYRNRAVSTDVFVYNVKCAGDESSLDECSHEEFTEISCRSVTAIICNTQHTRMRLRNIDNLGPNRGQVQMDMGGGSWGTVCVEYSSTAKVICKQFGLPS
ncbi:deleted in malignant brain tumors 1 protein-like [Pomacea canaliculata]|uniref:deleted in malignant brain tumors 1 protein-like n=1 Tax=Pomacea canaliculata TaxID=400727 RepID=UPI000D73DA38|nr:deleted in malignant brain tumors 1 protein-like [Pomacea canaliculata]